MAGSAAFSRSVSRAYPKTGALCGLASIALGWSRVAKGTHWPLDLAGGVVVGLLGEAITSQAFRRLGISACHPRKRKCRAATMFEKMTASIPNA